GREGGSPQDGQRGLLRVPVRHVWEPELRGSRLERGDLRDRTDGALMANRAYRRNIGTLDAQLVRTRCVISIGGSGAVTANTSGGPEVASVVHTSTGVYTITFGPFGGAGGYQKFC